MALPLQYDAARTSAQRPARKVEDRAMKRTLLWIALALSVPALSWATPVTSGKPLKTQGGAIRRVLRTEYPKGMQFNKPTLSPSGIANEQKWTAIQKITSKNPAVKPIEASGLVRTVVGGYEATGAEPVQP
jgi:hypothetical protein